MLLIRPWLLMAVPPNERGSGAWPATLGLFFVLGTWACFAAECRAPSFREGYVWEDSQSSVMMNISLRTSDFAPERLVCLAAALKHRYSDRKQISIVMFSSFAGAKKHTVPFFGDSPKPRVNWSLQNHAIYSFDADKREEYVEIMPFGQNRSFETKINLPVTSTPHCTLEMAGRCLLALASIEYPWNALKSKVSGTVTLEAVIARDGTVTGVRSIGPGVQPHEGQHLLVNAALQNLRTWYFEAGPHQDPIRIAYSYTIDSSGTAGHSSFQFDLPSKVEIRGRPPE
jgi:hypothetical protein